MMKKIFNKLSSLSRPVGHIVHIGAGQCSELQAYQELDPQRIVLVEADNQQAIQLKKTAQSKKIIDVLAVAICEKEEELTLKILTNQRDSSLLKPEELLTYYPSLTIASEQTVSTITLDKLLNKYTFESSFHHLLVIETPGVEGLIVKSASIEKIQQFSGIMIRTSTKKLYKEEDEQKNIIDFLESCGFDCNHQEDELYSPIFSTLYFQRNNEKIELQYSHQQIKQLISERDIQSKSASEKQNQIEQLTKTKDEQAKLANERQQNIEKITGERDGQAQSVAEKQSQIEQLTKTKDEQTKLATERQQNVEKITAERDVQVKSVSEKKIQIEQLSKAKDEQTKLATERQHNVEKITAERDTQAKSAAEKQDQIELQTITNGQEKSKRTAEHKQKIEQINQEYGKIVSDFNYNEDKLQKELEEAKQTVSLSLKLQMLKENDLKDLQQRYQTALETQENQHQLLNKLSERLSLAAGYFHQISEEQLTEQKNKITQHKIKPRSLFSKFLGFKNDK